jgi:hypothetical protein
MDTMEEINEEDSKKMGLFLGLVVTFLPGSYICEFPGDVIYDPFTGEGLGRTIGRRKLDDFQAEVMEMVRAN